MNEPNEGLSEANVEEAANSIGKPRRNVRLPAFVVAAMEPPVQRLWMSTRQDSNSVVIVLPDALNQDRPGRAEEGNTRLIGVLYWRGLQRTATTVLPACARQIARFAVKIVGNKLTGARCPLSRIAVASSLQVDLPLWPHPEPLVQTTPFALES
jgi:hypothetical protein